MKAVREHIERRQKQFANNDFFHWIERGDLSWETMWEALRGLAFWVMGFQDVLRINETRVTSPALRKIARHHRREDRGHDAWYLHDLAQIYGGIPDTRQLFDPRDTSTRDATYTIVAEALRATTDEERIAILLVLESSGHVFFERVISWFARARKNVDLRYFSPSHFEIELSHELFEKEINATLDAIELGDAERARVIGVVDRCFDQMNGMLAAIMARARGAASSKGHERGREASFDPSERSSTC